MVQQIYWEVAFKRTVSQRCPRIFLKLENNTCKNKDIPRLHLHSLFCLFLEIVIVFLAKSNILSLDEPMTQNHFKFVLS